MRWSDRVYGETRIDDPGIERLIETTTFQRLKGVMQAGPSALAFGYKTVTRFEHSLGVYTLLTRLGAAKLERVAGLLHDLSHTAFSHAVDFLYTSDEQDYHEGLKPLFINKPDIRSAIMDLGFDPSQFLDDSVHTILERPLPVLCEDRVDYFLRDGIACGAIDASQAGDLLGSLVVVEGVLAFDSIDQAILGRDLYAKMNKDFWASPTEGFIYNEFAVALGEALDEGLLTREDLLSDDASVLAILQSAGAGVDLESNRPHRPFRSGVLERL